MRMPRGLVTVDRRLAEVAEPSLVQYGINLHECVLDRIKIA